MNPILFIFVLISFLWVFSQFGKRISAARSLLWWGVFGFIFISILNPQIWNPLLHFLGIQVTSNFVLGSLVLFTLFQLIEESASQNKLLLKMRNVVSQISVERFIQNRTINESEKALIVLPTFNEEESVEIVINKLIELKKNNSHLDFCFVNDGSSDGTEAILKNRVPLNYVSHLTNFGVSGVLSTGFNIANHLGYKWVIQCDSDDQHTVEDIPQLIFNAEKMNADLLIGSRYVNAQSCKDNKESSTFLRRLGSRLISTLLFILFQTKKITDPTSGFRIYSKNAVRVLLRELPEEYPEPESIAILSKYKLKVVEINAKMNSRHGGKSSISGINSAKFMIKVITALIGFRIRSLFNN